MKVLRALNVVVGLLLVLVAAGFRFESLWLLVALAGIGMVGVDLAVEERRQRAAYRHSLEERKR